jgi:hypothetical protein
MRTRTSGILSRCSLSALIFQTTAQMPVMTPNMMAVFCFQFAGCAYQPPEGDQTSISYQLFAAS